jgi:hypothetical protein
MGIAIIPPAIKPVSFTKVLREGWLFKSLCILYIFKN